MRPLLIGRQAKGLCVLAGFSALSHYGDNYLKGDEIGETKRNWLREYRRMGLPEKDIGMWAACGDDELHN